MRLVASAVACLLAALWLGGAVLPPALAKGQLEVLAKFQNANLELDVATYVDPEADAAASKVGLLGFSSGAVRNSVALHADDWGALIALWAKAVRAQSRNWRTVGSLAEKGASDPAKLTLSAGPSIKVTISSPKGASASYTLAKADVGRFEAALNQVKDFFTK
jgi:hypothetical protein